MYILASQAFTCRPKRVLHIVHSREMKSVAVAAMMAQAKANVSQIYRAGEHTITDARFNYFDTVIVHDCSYANLQDYFRKLKKNDLPERLKRLATSRDKRIIIMGNTTNLCGPKLLVIPMLFNDSIKTNTTSQKPKVDHTHIATQANGLDILPFRVDTNFTFKADSSEYVFMMRTLSKPDEPIYLLDNNAILDSKQGVVQGAVYIPQNTSFTQVQHVLVSATEAQEEQDKSRTVDQKRDQATAPITKQVIKQTSVVSSIVTTQRK